MKKNNLILLTFIVVIFGLITFSVIKSNKAIFLNKKTSDYRYTSYDRELELLIKRYYYEDGEYKWCYNISEENLIKYYEDYNNDVTPLGKIILSGKYNCSDFAKDMYIEGDLDKGIVKPSTKKELDSVVVMVLDSIKSSSKVVKDYVKKTKSEKK